MEPLSRHRRQPPDSLKYEESVVERTSLPFSSTSKELLLTAVDTLLKRAYSRPRMRGRYAGRAALCCTLLRAPSWEKAVHFKQTVGDWERASRIVRGQLESDHPQAPVEAMALILSNLSSGASGVQMGLFRDAQKGPAPVAGGGGAAAPGPHEREACPVQSGGRRPLASCAGDAHCAGFHRPFRRGRHEIPFHADPCASSGGAGA